MGLQHGGPPPDHFSPIVLVNVPVGLKVQQCLLESTDRVAHSLSNNHQDKTNLSPSRRCSPVTIPPALRVQIVNPHRHPPR